MLQAEAEHILSLPETKAGDRHRTNCWKQLAECERWQVLAELVAAQPRIEEKIEALAA